MLNAPAMAIDAVGDLITGPTAMQVAMDFITAEKAKEKAKEDARPTDRDFVDWMRGGAVGVPKHQPHKK